MKKEYGRILTLLLATIVLRLIPHPPNFSPLIALCFFGAAHFQKRYEALLLPLVAMLLSDLVLGFHPFLWVVYGSFALFSLLGWRLRTRMLCLAAVPGASLFFYCVTNFAYWYQTPLYAKNSQGLLLCMAAGIPFFNNALAGDIFYSLLLFGGAALLAWKPFPFEIKT